MTRDNLGGDARTRHWNMMVFAAVVGVLAFVAAVGTGDKGKGPVEVKGEARGDSFVISSSQGIVTAPASVHPANPWSAKFLHSNTMMRPDSGRIEQVRVGSGQETVVKIDGASIPAVKFEIDGSTRYTD